jgi:hypothetical protein
MKIVQLLSGISTAITNEEQDFIEKHPTHVKITSLDEHNNWLAQNLVRKGIYAISKDNNVIVKNLHENNT